MVSGPCDVMDMDFWTCPDGCVDAATGARARGRGDRVSEDAGPVWCGAGGHAAAAASLSLTADGGSEVASALTERRRRRVGERA